VTDAGFAVSDGKQNGNPLRRGNGVQRRCDLFGDLSEGLFFHIRSPEYIVQLIRLYEYNNCHILV
jgi:hypothetical protein